MALGNYSELVASVSGWLNRTDAAARIPDFILLAEERMNRALRVRQMEVSLTPTTIASNVIAVPAGTVGVKTLWITGRQDDPLLARTYEFILTQGTQGVAKGWAWLGDNFYFDGPGDAAGVLYQAIPALNGTNTTNWLLTEHPSAYLYGALAEAFDWARNDKERDRWKGRFEAVLADIGGTDMRDRFSGPLVARKQ